MLKINKSGKLEYQDMTLNENETAIVVTWILKSAEDMRKAEKLLIQFLTRDNCKFGTKIIDTCDINMINSIDDDLENQ